MNRKRLRWNLCSTYLLMVVLALSVAVLSACILLKQQHLDQSEQLLAMQAQLLRRSLEKKTTFRLEEVSVLCADFDAELGVRVTVVQASGRVLFDSEEAALGMDNHADRPEIRKALSGQIGVSNRYSYTLAQEMLYVAVPVQRGGTIWGAARISVSTVFLQKHLREIYERTALAAVPAFVLAAVGSLMLSFRISSPLEDIEQGVLRFTQGGLRHRIHVAGPLEITRLAESCNRMAAQLDEQTGILKKQLGLLESTFRSMAEAVVVTDREGRLLRCNHAAGRLFGLNPDAVGNRDIQEVIRHADVQQFLAKVLKNGGPAENVLAVGTGRERILNAHGTQLRSETGQSAGALLVFRDITRLKQLETMRRDFAANVSHELRTPITAISGFVETLREGALHEPEHAERFLAIIAKNVRRLHSIIEDLLALARLEQEEEQGQISLTLRTIRPTLENAVALCSPMAREKRVAMEVFCADELAAHINADLLEQAVVNLLDNAIKYSRPDSMVEVRAEQTQAGLTISVEDSGCGISGEHHARLFERFYRVDKARSCKLGGTGLGLAIVKHIVQAHQGTIAVRSALGKGSVFSIRLHG